jgi:hypothetical protein
MSDYNTSVMYNTYLFIKMTYKQATCFDTCDHHQAFLDFLVCRRFLYANNQNLCYSILFLCIKAFYIYKYILNIHVYKTIKISKSFLSNKMVYVLLFKISDLFTSLMKHICLVMNKINQVLEKNKLMHK